MKASLIGSLVCLVAIVQGQERVNDWINATPAEAEWVEADDNVEFAETSSSPKYATAPVTHDNEGQNGQVKPEAFLVHLKPKAKQVQETNKAKSKFLLLLRMPDGSEEMVTGARIKNDYDDVMQQQQEEYFEGQQQQQEEGDSDQQQQQEYGQYLTAIPDEQQEQVQEEEVQPQQQEQDGGDQTQQTEEPAVQQNDGYSMAAPLDNGNGYDQQKEDAFDQQGQQQDQDNGASWRPTQPYNLRQQTKGNDYQQQKEENYDQQVQQQELAAPLAPLAPVARRPAAYEVQQTKGGNDYQQQQKEDNYDQQTQQQEEDNQSQQKQDMPVILIALPPGGNALQAAQNPAILSQISEAQRQVYGNSGSQQQQHGNYGNENSAPVQSNYGQGVANNDKYANQSPVPSYPTKVQLSSPVNTYNPSPVRGYSQAPAPVRNVYSNSQLVAPVRPTRKYTKSANFGGYGNSHSGAPAGGFGSTATKGGRVPPAYPKNNLVAPVSLRPTQSYAARQNTQSTYSRPAPAQRARAPVRVRNFPNVARVPVNTRPVLANPYASNKRRSADQRANVQSLNTYGAPAPVRTSYSNNRQRNNGQQSPTKNRQAARSPGRLSAPRNTYQAPANNNYGGQSVQSTKSGYQRSKNQRQARAQRPNSSANQYRQSSLQSTKKRQNQQRPYYGSPSQPLSSYSNNQLADISTQAVNYADSLNSASTSLSGQSHDGKRVVLLLFNHQGKLTPLPAANSRMIDARYA
ncbi:hypothetical protein HDE_10814 [Halotydeus destructor]|nr:hypothetical protein HDE_10814 [Halotydeus destructor]